MKKLLEDSERFYQPKKRPSGHDISSKFSSSNGGAIPSNLLQISNTESNSQYLRYCSAVGVKAHPARFPEKLPSFFIQFLTEPCDIVLDIFAGSNTTGAAAEQAGRRWLAFERDKKYLLASTFRFIDELSPNELIEFWSNAISSKNTIELMRSQQEMVLMEESAEYKANGRRWA
jgi:DNA modification methylase